MKSLITSILLLWMIVPASLAQKINFSGYLASGGGVHSSTPSVADKDGNIFVAGATRDGLRVTHDAFQKNYQGHTDETGGDVFLMKLSSSGELLYSTYIGGPGSEFYCLQMTLDHQGNVYVGFTTDSPDLPVSGHACQKSGKGDNDHYIIKFSNDCRYLASTYLGGSGSDHWTRLSVDQETLYLIGKSISPDFPVTQNAIQKEYDNSSPPDSSQRWLAGDITITALSLNLEKLLFSTYLGGNSLDFVRSCSFGSDGRIILTGGTYSQNYPTTKDAYQKSIAGNQDGFLTIISRNLSKIDYSTFIGGDSTDQVNASFSEDAHHLILAGQTKSPDFPVTADAADQTYNGGNSDGFIMNFNLKLNKPEYSSFIGGSRTDWLNFAAKTDDHKYVLAGTTASKDYPVTGDALFRIPGGGLDLVILLLDKTLKKIEYATSGGGSKQRVMDPCASYDKNGKLLISSMCVSPDFPVTLKYTEPDGTWTNCIWKFDLRRDK